MYGDLVGYTVLNALFIVHNCETKDTNYINYSSWTEWSKAID